MPFWIPRDKRSNQPPSSEESQHLIQPKNTYKRFKISISQLFRRSRYDNTTSQMPAIDKTASSRKVVQESHASVDIANDISRPHRTSRHDSFHPANRSMQAESCNPHPNPEEPAIAPIATQFQSAQNVNISGNTPFTNVGMNTGNVTNTVINYGGTHGLEKLEKVVSFAALHDSAEQDPTRRCHPGTRKNVLSRLRDWTDNPNTSDRIFWLHGPAGAGKSAIAQTIAHAYKHKEIAATFFFYRSDTSRNDGNRLFPTLAWQLAFSIPATKGFIIHALNDTPHIPTKSVEAQFEHLVAYPFQPTNNIASQMVQPAPVVIIDGLDECSDERLQRRILTVIGNAVNDSLVPLRFLICSRPEALIEEALDAFKDITLRIDLATLDDSNHDIEKFLVDQFSDIRSKRDLVPTWPGPETIEEFLFKSSGNFIFAATVMRYISDEDYNPEDQLDIVRNLKPRGKMSPFALLDELYLQILKQQRDQDFLKNFLALLVGRSTADGYNLREDDAILMNISKKDLHLKLRRMRSLLEFEPFIEVHHKSFLDFLQDPSRSDVYHIGQQAGQKRYLELIVDCVVQHMEKCISHEECSNPRFRYVTQGYPPTIVLPVEDWQEALKPLQDFQDKLLNMLEPKPCRFSLVMRQLLLHLAVLEGFSKVSELDMNKTVTERSSTLMTEANQNAHNNDLNDCISSLLSCLHKKNSVLVVDMVMIDRMSSLLAFDLAETVARVRSVRDAQKLINCIDLLIDSQAFLNHCVPDAARKAALLASEIFARVPLLPQSIFLHEPAQHYDRLWNYEGSIDIEYACRSAFISRILDHNYILPLFFRCRAEVVSLVIGNVDEQNESVAKWLKNSGPSFVTRTRVMLEIARTVRYIHSTNVVGGFSSLRIDSVGVSILIESIVTKIHQEYITLDSNLRAKIMFWGFFRSQIRDSLFHDLSYFTQESNVSAFGDLFQSVCFDGAKKRRPNRLVKQARQLIERCHAEDPKRRPTMESIVKEMETWNLT